MKRFKRILLGLLVVLLLAQIPFLYRRYQTGKIAEKISEIQSQRQKRTSPGYTEYKGIIHAHTSLGGHSTGGFDELIDAANANDLDFVMMTEHYSDKYDTAGLSLSGIYGKTLFVSGNEVDTSDSDRFLMIPGGADAAGFRNGTTNAFLEKIHPENRLALITYPEKFKSWDSNFDGIEVFSLNTAARQMNPVILFFDLMWSASDNYALTFAGKFKRPDTNLQQFDEISKKRRISLFVGTDAHSNLGFHAFGLSTGGKLLNIQIDPYGVLFGISRMHILVETGLPLTRENLIGAVRNGHFYTGFDVFGDPSGFSFDASDGSEQRQMGDEAVNSDRLMLRVSSPVKARSVVYKNGEKFFEESQSGEFSVKPDGPGVYRVEVYQDAIGETGAKMPWIISNPIYVR